MGDMLKIKIAKLNKTVEYPKGIIIEGIAKEYQKFYPSKIVASLFNNDIRELSKTLERDGTLDFIDLTSEDGVRIYQRGLMFLAYVAAKKIFPDKKMRVRYSLGKGIYCEFDGWVPSEEELKNLKDKMRELVEMDIPFLKEELYKFDALELFEKNGMKDKIELLKYRTKSTINIYWFENYFNYYYGHMVPSTSYITLFDVVKVNDGFVLVHPDITSPNELPVYVPQVKMAKAYEDRARWGKIVGMETVGDLNKIVADGKARELIMMCELLHEKEISKIADTITSKGSVKLVLCAGPSSSGKTTFSKRLSLQLRVNGFEPYAISLDDYFVERDKTPLGPDGKPDFESIEALDLELFSQNMNDIFSGKTVELPKFNFKTGKREYKGEMIKPTEKTILVVEGIHGLNPLMTKNFDPSLVYKVYVSALTQTSLDEDNRIPTTDVRIIRRMIRDYNFRGHSALMTLQMWQNVRIGEEKNIFPYQEEADVMFNSALPYELAVLKNFAMPLLLQVDNSTAEYSQARRLIRFLDYFLPIVDFDVIPATSIIREFIGSSYFHY
ncbi:nucleoside kinase [Athalassotoga saccharophila]|uniref:nucleoside kinase n=1 Tax=Athalassotoga saccharophila TaxID=1441386 RepID=UPI0018D7ED29|nr:nucleoside kinase [Athalassotoga saccharophila]BBJ28414.1 threonine--tRNA ligase [Athalassotoga saccharophila]